SQEQHLHLGELVAEVLRSLSLGRTDPRNSTFTFLLKAAGSTRAPPHEVLSKLPPLPPQLPLNLRGRRIYRGVPELLRMSASHPWRVRPWLDSRGPAMVGIKSVNIISVNVGWARLPPTETCRTRCSSLRRLRRGPRRR